jgi:hypothetical protein
MRPHGSLVLVHCRVQGKRRLLNEEEVLHALGQVDSRWELQVFHGSTMSMRESIALFRRWACISE